MILPPVDPEGFLLDSNQWSPEIAEQLAAQDGVQLSEEHWQVIDFARQFYQDHQLIPPLRGFIKAMKTELAPQQAAELASSIKLHQLFPDSPIKWICKYAGLPKPRHCM